MQMMGTFLGATITYVMTNNIVTAQRDVLLSIEGTNVWSGQQVQAFNSLAVMFGGLAHELFDVGKTYQWLVLIMLPGFIAPLPTYFLHRKYPNVGFNNINMAVLILYISWLCVGINSSLLAFFFFGLGAQWFMRKRYPNVFLKYNYLVSAALDGGTSIIIFILSFAIFGAAGNEVDFRESSTHSIIRLQSLICSTTAQWWGNNLAGNFDKCLYVG